MTTKLYRTGESEVTVRDPDVPIDKTRLRIGAQRRTLDGSLKQHIVTSKWRWTLNWTLLTSAQYATLIAELDREQDMTFAPPDGGSHTVRVIGDPAVTNNPYSSYDVSAVLETT